MAKSEDDARCKVAVITGGNTGIGLALAFRLLSKENMIVCLACRNLQKADAAKAALLAAYPDGRVDVVKVDMADLRSVYAACRNISQRYAHIDLLYMNAGTLGNTRITWGPILKMFFTLNFAKLLFAWRTGIGMLIQDGGGRETRDGLQEVFATNVFAHFAMIKELIGVGTLGGAQTTKIIWTGSENAHPDNFSLSDVQCATGNAPYSSSKQATQLLSAALNDNYNKQNVYTYETSPGTVVTNMTKSVVPAWFWPISYPVFCLFRVLNPASTASAYNGSESLIWLADGDVYKLDTHARYDSQVTIWNRPYVHPVPMAIDKEQSAELFNTLSKMESDFSRKYKKVIS